MNFLDIDLSDVTTNTLNTLSDLSDTISPKQSGGGIFDFLFGGHSASKCDSAVLAAARLGNYSVVEFMIDQGAVDLSAQDQDGNTILHYLVMPASPNRDLIKKILKLSKDQTGGSLSIDYQIGGRSDFINLQNKDGDTPLILAVKNEHHDLCSELILAGSDKELRNKKGLRVETETPEEFYDLSKHKQEVSALPLREKGKDDLFESPSSPLVVNSPIFIASVTKEDSDKLLEPFMKLLNRPSGEAVKTSDVESFEGGWTESLKQDGGCGCGSSKPPVVMADTESLLNDLQKYFSFDGSQSGGNCGNGLCGIKTPVVIGSNDQQEGGKKKKSVKSHRSSATERNFELGRILNNQTDEIIKRVVDKIQKLMEEDKKTFKGLKADEATARAAKAILWKMVKEQHPDLKGSLDVAIEMEKIATDDMIKSLKPTEIKKIMKAIEEHKAEKEKSMKDHKAKKEEKMEMSSTSSENIPEMGNLSETSA